MTKKPTTNHRAQTNDHSSTAVVTTDSETQADVFINTGKLGITRSLKSFSIPLFLMQRSLAAGTSDKNETIITTKYRDMEINYSAAPIKDKDGNVTFYHATKSAKQLLDAIIDLINEKVVLLEQIDKNNFAVTFNRADVDKYLLKKKQSQNGRIRRNSYEILEKAHLTVTQTVMDDTGHTKRLTLSGAYLQSVARVEGEDDGLNGYYRGTLHPIIAHDLMKGNFRGVETEFLETNSQSAHVYKTLIHSMRHIFTNADSKAERFSYDFYFDDLIFSSGINKDMPAKTKVRIFNEVKKLLIEKKVISQLANFTYSQRLDTTRGVKDMYCQLMPTTHWGESQRRDNQISKHIKARISEISNL